MLDEKEELEAQPMEVRSQSWEEGGERRTRTMIVRVRSKRIQHGQLIVVQLSS